MTKPKRRAARRPTPRTVDAELATGLYAGWAVTARADFPARVLADLQSGSIDRICAALDRIVVSHNLPGVDGELAPSMADVDPYAGLFEIVGLVVDKIGTLPNR